MNDTTTVSVVQRSVPLGLLEKTLTVWIFGFQALSFDNSHVEDDNRRLKDSKHKIGEYK
jgi:hypothetical protein